VAVDGFADIIKASLHEIKAGAGCRDRSGEDVRLGISDVDGMFHGLRLAI
jgi:hypothetical protein